MYFFSGVMNKGDLRSGTAEAVFLTICFVVFAGLAFAFRDRTVVGIMINISDRPLQTFDTARLLCNDLPACFRIGPHWLTIAINSILALLADATQLLRDRAYPNILTLEVKHGYLALFGAILTRILLLLPILFVTFAAYRTIVTRFLFLVAVFFAICGWARSGALFSEQNFAIFDYAAIGFVFTLFLLLVRGLALNIVGAAGILIAGQLLFEHLGFITGVAVALYAAFGGAGWRQSIRLLVTLGAVSLLTAAILYGAISVFVGAPYWVEQGKTFGYTFEVYGRMNLLDIHDIGENILELLAYPIAAGIVLGLISALGGEARQNREEIGARLKACLAVTAAFFCAVGVGLFTSGLTYEMGRQLIPLACLTVLTTAYAIQLVYNRAGSRIKADVNA